VRCIFLFFLFFSFPFSFFFSFFSAVSIPPQIVISYPIWTFLVSILLVFSPGIHCCSRKFDPKAFEVGASRISFFFLWLLISLHIHFQMLSLFVSRKLSSSNLF